MKWRPWKREPDGNAAAAEALEAAQDQLSKAKKQTRKVDRTVAAAEELAERIRMTLPQPRRTT